MTSPMRLLIVSYLLLSPLAMMGCQQTPAHVPDGYTLVYSQDFDSGDAIGDFRFTDAQAWRIAQDDAGNGYLELHGESEYRPEFRSPYNIGLINLGRVGSFVLDVDMQQYGREYPHRDMCVFFGFSDPDHFYYTHLASTGDQNAHQVFIVNDEPRTPITTDRTTGIDWGQGAWRHVRIIHDANQGSTEVYFDDMQEPVQIADDTTFTSGYIGFGSFDDVGRIDNVMLWAASMDETACEYFQPNATNE